jgi:outer membrane protein OmpU
MKKVLFGTTALVLSAGVAFADAHAGVSVSGSAEFAVGESGGGDITFAPNIVINFAGSGETDSGMAFGFDYGIVDTSTGGDIGLDNWEVYISDAWGKLLIGDGDANAFRSVAGLADIGFNGLGVDNVAENTRGNGINEGVLYSNTFGPATVYLSTALAAGASTSDLSYGLKFTTGAITAGVAALEDSAGGDDVIGADVSGSFGAIGFDIYYADADVSGSSYGTILSYDAGVATITFGYADNDIVADPAMGVGFKMDLGGGASLAGGVADDGVDTNWDLGVSMSF